MYRFHLQRYSISQLKDMLAAYFLYYLFLVLSHLSVDGVVLPWKIAQVMTTDVRFSVLSRTASC